MEGLKILLVDDEEELVFTLAERLELRGHKVDAVTDGREAVSRVAEKAFDVAVVDLKMPGFSGLEVLKTIKAQRPSVPVIMLTGHAAEGTEGHEEGAYAYLYKPVALSELLDTMLEAAGRKQRG